MNQEGMPPALQKLQDKFIAYDKRIATLESHNRELLAVNQVLREALQSADQFITNGIDLGYIRMPDIDTPDPAHQTPKIVKSALAIKPGDIALIEVAAVDAMETGVEWNPLTLDDVKAGAKLYTIQTKRNTE